MLSKYLKSYAYIAAGAFLLAAGLSMFLAPLRMATGGVSSIGILLLYLLHIPMAITTFLINALLFLFGYKFLGRQSVIKTLFGIFFFSLFLALTENFPPLSDDIFIAALCGGILTGLGTGLVIRVEASTGGSDFAALILHRRFAHLSVPLLITGIDCAIILFSGLVFRSLTITVYSLVALFLSMKTADLVLAFGNAAKSVYILSKKSEEIAESIQGKFARGVTGIHGRGMYRGENMLLLLSVVSPKELPGLLRLTRTIDPAAFIIISDVHEVLGEGFKAGTAYDIFSKNKL